jgi:gas vesicle protein
MANDGTSSGTVLVAFVVGALAGAAVALLYAPATGEETRRRLAEKAREGRERAEGAARDGRDALRRHRETLTDAIDRGREVFEQVRKEPL